MMKELYEDLHPGSLEPSALPEGMNEGSQLGVPEVEDCESAAVPSKAESPDGKKKILVPEVTSMVKYLFKNHRLQLYSFLNACLRNGTLADVTGVKVLNKVFRKETCSFPGVTFWKIDREDFYADVSVELKLETPMGTVDWKGYLVCWCSFKGDFSCSVEYLAEDLKGERDSLTLLSPFLVPYYTNKRVDQVAEEIWMKYLPEALRNPQARNAAELARRMGLEIRHLPIYNHRGVDSIIFFAEDELIVGTDKSVKYKTDDGKVQRRPEKEKQPKTVVIPANTIVVNSNLIKRDYSAFNIFHECFHNDQHYMFFRLQEMTSNDVRNVKTVEVVVDEGKELTDPIYFMEKQANRGAYGLMMPATPTREMIHDECEKAEGYKHFGERFEMVGMEMAKQLCLPHFRIRARMIQLGNVQAKGALNYVDRKLIQPFAFDIDAWREQHLTFVVDEATVRGLAWKNADFRAIMNSGKYVYADGHVVRNSPRFIERKKDKLVLTEWANAHVDDCCLRFVRVYVQKNVGQYVYGRMYYDADYVRQTQFYLDDLINQQHLDELDAKDEYIKAFPKEFVKAVEQLRNRMDMSYEKLSEVLHMDNSTLMRWMKEPRFYRNEDFLTALCLALDLPDWISRLVFKRAGLQLDEDNKRHRALLHILRVQSADGITAANDYLTRNNLEPLRY